MFEAKNDDYTMVINSDLLDTHENRVAIYNDLARQLSNWVHFGNDFTYGMRDALESNAERRKQYAESIAKYLHGIHFMCGRDRRAAIQSGIRLIMGLGDLVTEELTDELELLADLHADESGRARLTDYMARYAIHDKYKFEVNETSSADIDLYIDRLEESLQLQKELFGKESE